MLTRLMKKRLAPVVVVLLVVSLYPFFIAKSWQSALPSSTANSVPAPTSWESVPAPNCPICSTDLSNIGATTLSVSQAEFADHVKSINIERNFTHMIRANHITEHPLRMDYHGNYSVRIVYYVNTKLNHNYPEWIMGQWSHIHRVMRPELVSLHVVATAHNCKNETGMAQAVQNITNNVTQNPQSRMKVFLECHDREDYDTHEYYGIKKVWDLAHKYPGHEDILVYFHTKDITHGSHYNDNPFYARFLFESMDRVLEVLDIFPKINRVGRHTGIRGLMFYNFWYTRASWVIQVEEPLYPVPGFNRYYYEEWLGHLDMPRGNLTPSQERPPQDYPYTTSGCYALDYNYGNSEHFNIGTWFENVRGIHLPW